MDVRGAPGLTADDIDRLCAEGRVETVPRRTIVPLDGPTVVLVIGGFFRIFRNAAFVRDVTLGLAARGAKTETHERNLSPVRETFKYMASQIALDLVRRALLG